MNYCSHCGSADLQFKKVGENSVPRYVCPNCHTIHYQNPKIVVGCLPIYQQKILLCKRGIEPRKGFWNLPAGFMELNETVEEGAKRETREETNIEVDLIRLHSMYTITHLNQVVIHFLATITTFDFITNQESLEIQLFPENEIPWDDIAFHSNHFALSRYLEGNSQHFSGVHIGQSNWKPEE